MRAFFETTDNFYVELMLVFTNDELRPSVQVLPSALTRIKSANISHSTQEVTSVTPLLTAINHALTDARINVFPQTLSASNLVRTIRAHAVHFAALFKDPAVTPLWLQKKYGTFTSFLNKAEQQEDWLNSELAIHAYAQLLKRVIFIVPTRGTPRACLPLISLERAQPLKFSSFKEALFLRQHQCLNDENDYRAFKVDRAVLTNEDLGFFTRRPNAQAICIEATEDFVFPVKLEGQQHWGLVYIFKQDAQSTHSARKVLFFDGHGLAKPMPDTLPSALTERLRVLGQFDVVAPHLPAPFNYPASVSPLTCQRKNGTLILALLAYLTDTAMLEEFTILHSARPLSEAAWLPRLLKRAEEAALPIFNHEQNLKLLYEVPRQSRAPLFLNIGEYTLSV